MACFIRIATGLLGYKAHGEDIAYDKHNEKGRQMKRGWGHFFRDGTKLENHTPQPRENEFRERAMKAIEDPGGMGLF